MSTTIMGACWPLQMPPTPKAVLISLADNANDHGHCWPSLTKICERTCFGRTAVIDAIKWLESAGAIRADRSNRYSTSYVVTPALYVPTELVRDANQSGKRTSSDAGELVRLADNEVRETDDEVRQADTNRQEPPITVSKSKRQRGRKPDPEISVTLPPWLDADLWQRWVDDRKARRHAMTQDAAELAVRRLAEFRNEGYTPKQVIENAIELGWRGLFRPKTPPTGEGHGNAQRAAGNSGSVGDAVRRAIDERQAREHVSRGGNTYEGTYTAEGAGQVLAENGGHVR